jgi:protein phosphatase
MRVTQIDYLHETGAKKNQEDFLWPLPGTASEKDRVFIVCDGVGGSEGGEVASRYIAEWVGQALQRTPPSGVDLPLINTLLEEARARLVEHATLKGLGRDMATTFTLVCLLKDRAFIAWCGDSRVYHLRRNAILYRTTDHSLVHSLVRNGELTEEDARDHPQKNLLLKAIRADEPGPEAEGHWIDDVREGDYFLLCSDGLLENISDSDVLFLLQQSEHREGYLAKAFRQYCYNKTRDNYSMYLIEVSPEPAVAAAPDPEVVRPKMGWMFVLLIILVVAAAFVIRQNYLAPQKAKFARPASVARPVDTANIPAVVPTAASAKDTLNP